MSLTISNERFPSLLVSAIRLAPSVPTRQWSLRTPSRRRILVLLLAMGLQFVPQSVLAQVVDWTSRFEVAAAKTAASATFPASGSDPQPESLSSASGTLFRYGLQAGLTDTLGIEAGIQKLRLPVQLHRGAQRPLEDHINATIFTLGSNLHVDVSRIELLGGVFAAYAARDTLAFSSSTLGTTTMTIGDAWTWGAQGTVAVRPSASAPWSIGLFVSYIDSRLRVAGATTTQLSVAPTNVGIVVSFRH